MRRCWGKIKDVSASWNQIKDLPPFNMSMIIYSFVMQVLLTSLNWASRQVDRMLWLLCKSKAKNSFRKFVNASRSIFVENFGSSNGFPLNWNCDGIVLVLSTGIILIQSNFYLFFSIRFDHGLVCQFSSEQPTPNKTIKKQWRRKTICTEQTHNRVIFGWLP